MIKKGVTIGVNQGKVIEIQPDKIIIEEQSRDSSGAVVPKTVEMLLRTKTKESLSIRSEASR
jgi:Tfp pilus assembly protein PilP